MVWICKDCTARYAVGAPRCPQCDSTEHVEEGHEDMPKITVHGGASIADEETTDEQPEQPEGSEQSSDGNSSSASAETQSSSGEKTESSPRKTARAAANRSK